MYDRRPFPPVKQLNAHEHVGDGELQSGKLNAPARQTGWSCINPPPLHEGVREFLYVGLSQILYVVRKLERDRNAHACEDRCVPEHAELSRRGLFDLKVGRTRLMRRGDSACKKQTGDTQIGAGS